ncbi:MULTISPECIES: nuclear transport factor 2 family protein [Sphingobacterium]|uniref:Nuclear transport factor 2 family protein n=1 Tax=Sphingobacterium athyrii TaxID=2152717 RepID=A0A363NWS0_9SPHI|nr:MULTISPECIES: nuclear transport factor 2 family protein [Sphingobacterium]PUV25266.1 nuclear transport factor 2 family protein [Sphingobacterium athyrii]QIH34618.1 nuclear transport factor 2 family protein [Sphingobacterium sp. DR205]
MKSTKYIVLSFLESLNREDFAAAYELLDKDMVFEGVLGSRHTADHYIADMKKMKFKYNIKEVMTNGNHVAIFYNIDMGGKEIFSAGWYQVENELILKVKVVFDPRPLIADK